MEDKLEYEEPTLLDLEDVAGGAEAGGCNTSGSCSTGGGAAEEMEAAKGVA